MPFTQDLCLNGTSELEVQGEPHPAKAAWVLQRMRTGWGLCGIPQLAIGSLAQSLPRILTLAQGWTSESSFY